jgi:prepilin-type N-terminal cleavage/methylation domain-containing protein
MLRKRKEHGTPERVGFTLIELLIVMAIITMLLAITSAALFKGFAWAYRSATFTTIGKIDQRLDRRLDQIRKETQEIDVSPLIAAYATSQRQARAIQQKMFVKWSFPRCYREAMLNYWQSRACYPAKMGSPFAGAIWTRIQQSMGYPPLGPADYTNPAVFAYPTNASPNPPWPSSNAQAIEENSSCLLIVFNLLGSKDELSSGEIGASTTLIPLNSQSTTPQVLTDGYGTPMMYDLAPGNPLGSGPSQGRLNYWFNILGARAALAFPAKYPTPSPNANVDVDDPESLLAALPTAQWQQLEMFYNLSNTYNPPYCTSNPASYWWSTFNPGPPNGSDSAPANRYPQFAPPIILSAGPDRTFGFQNPNNPLLNGIDDIDSYSWKISKQGQ